MPNKLNHKQQPQARVCEENKEKELEENDCQVKHFVVNGLTLEGCKRTSDATDQAEFHCKDCSQHKGISYLHMLNKNN